jgi:hypothetical protein
MPGVPAGEVSLLQEKPDLGDGLEDDEDEDEDDEGPGGIDDAPDWWAHEDLGSAVWLTWCAVPRAMGKGEQPSGTEAMKGGWKMRVFTSEQQGRLGINKYGEHKKSSMGGILGESKSKSDDETSTKSKRSDDDDSGSADTDDTSIEDDTSIDDAADAVMPSDDPWPWRK